MRWDLILSRLIAAIVSLVQAADLRNRLYLERERLAARELALDDIRRIARSDAENRDQLIVDIVDRVIGRDNDR